MSDFAQRVVETWERERGKPGPRRCWTCLYLTNRPGQVCEGCEAYAHKQWDGRPRRCAACCELVPAREPAYATGPDQTRHLCPPCWHLTTGRPA